MSDFQSIAPSYRVPDTQASGIPMDGIPTLGFMREKVRSPFGERLFQARTRAGLTQPQLAKAAGMSQSTLAEAESIGQGSSYTAQIAAACGIRAEWLASGDGPMVDASVWPFSEELRAEVAKLPPQTLVRLENVMRAHLELVPMGYGRAPSSATNARTDADQFSQVTQNSSVTATTSAPDTGNPSSAIRQAQKVRTGGERSSTDKIQEQRRRGPGKRAA